MRHARRCSSTEPCCTPITHSAHVDVVIHVDVSTVWATSRRCRRRGDSKRLPCAVAEGVERDGTRIGYYLCMLEEGNDWCVILCIVQTWSRWEDQDIQASSQATCRHWKGSCLAATVSARRSLCTRVDKVVWQRLELSSNTLQTLSSSTMARKLKLAPLGGTSAGIDHSPACTQYLSSAAKEKLPVISPVMHADRSGV